MAQTINLNIIPRGISDVVYVSQFDVGREITFKLYENTSLYTIPADASVIIGGKKGDNHVFAYSATILTGRQSVKIVTTEQMTAYAGENLCQLRISKDGNDIATVNFRMIVQERPDADGDASETDIPALVELAQEQVYDAEAWAEGTKDGVPVTSSDPQYHNNAKYWAEQAAGGQIQSDWAQTDNTKKDYIKNKPESIEAAIFILAVTATGWSNTIDADGFYTQDVSVLSSGVAVNLNANKPLNIKISGSTLNTRPTDAQSAAYNMIDSNFYYPDDPVTDGSFLRFYTKTKPTIDFYIRAEAFKL